MTRRAREAAKESRQGKPSRKAIREADGAGGLCVVPPYGRLRWAQPSPTIAQCLNGLRWLGHPASREGNRSPGDDRLVVQSERLRSAGRRRGRIGSSIVVSCAPNRSAAQLSKSDADVWTFPTDANVLTLRADRNCRRPMLTVPTRAMPAEVRRKDITPQIGGL